MKTDEVNVKLRLTMLKLLHAERVVKMSSAKGKKSSKVGGEQLELRMQFALRVEADDEGDKSVRVQ